ncbi:MAG TPA: hypothetical protein DER01_09780 [Phycisphaerales bacterium]|nr:hypothetical protein [Phycisphaerales bacterium]
MITHDLAETATKLGCAESTLKKWCYEGKIGHFKPGDGIFIFGEHHIDEFLSQCEVKRGNKTNGSQAQERIVGDSVAGRREACAKQELRPGEKGKQGRRLPTLHEVA